MKIGDKYRHFKGNIYEIITLAKDAETLNEMVVYKSIKTNEVWVRPLLMFLSLDDMSQKEDNITGQKYRFEKIEEE